MLQTAVPSIEDEMTTGNRFEGVLVVVKIVHISILVLPDSIPLLDEADYFFPHPTT